MYSLSWKTESWGHSWNIPSLKRWFYTCIYIPCTCNQLWNIKEIQNVWVLKKGKAFNHICSEMHVRIYGLIWAKVVTVVYILRLIRNHDLASVGQTPWSYQATGISLLPCICKLSDCRDVYQQWQNIIQVCVQSSLWVRTCRTGYNLVQCTYLFSIYIFTRIQCKLHSYWASNYTLIQSDPHASQNEQITTVLLVWIHNLPWQQ